MLIYGTRCYKLTDDYKNCNGIFEDRYLASEDDFESLCLKSNETHFFNRFKRFLFDKNLQKQLDQTSFISN